MLKKCTLFFRANQQARGPPRYIAPSQRKRELESRRAFEAAGGIIYETEEHARAAFAQGAVTAAVPQPPVPPTPPRSGAACETARATAQQMAAVSVAAPRAPAKLFARRRGVSTVSIRGHRDESVLNHTQPAGRARAYVPSVLEISHKVVKRLVKERVDELRSVARTQAGAWLSPAERELADASVERDAQRAEDAANGLDTSLDDELARRREKLERLERATGAALTYVGCFSSENWFRGRDYQGGALLNPRVSLAVNLTSYVVRLFVHQKNSRDITRDAQTAGSRGAYFHMAVKDAIDGARRYFAVARRDLDGHGFVFDALSPDATVAFPEGDLVGGGCENACVDDDTKLCGCTDESCSGTLERRSLFASLRYGFFEI